MKAQNLKLIIYTSSAAEKFTDLKLAELLKTSRVYNKTNKISGVLLFQEDCFIQCIEGFEKDVDFLFKKIKNDGRHKNILILTSRIVDTLSFRNWSMGFSCSSPALKPYLESWEEIDNLRHKLASPNQLRPELILLKRFLSMSAREEF